MENSRKNIIGQLSEKKTLKTPMNIIAKQRLLQERNNWRKEHPYGFSAKPMTAPDGES